MNCDVVVVGAGVAGTIAAVSLADIGLKVVVVEKEAALSRRMGGEIIHPRGVQALRDLGLNTGLCPGVTVEGFQVTEAEMGQVLMPYGGGQVGVAIPHDRLQKHFFERIQRHSGISVMLGCETDELENHQSGVTLRGHLLDGKALAVSAMLLVGADGMRSQIRTMAGIAHSVHRMSRVSSMTIPTSLLPNSALGHLFIGHGRLTFAYALPDGRSRLMVDHRCGEAQLPSNAAEMAALMSTACSRRMREEVAGIGRDCRVMHFPTSVLTMRKPSRRRTLLIGDAAGSCHPVTASGITSILLDAESLVDSIRRGSDDMGAAMAAYNLEWSMRQMVRVALSNTLYEAIASASPERAYLRRAMMSYWRTERGRSLSTALLSMSDLRQLSLSRAMAGIFCVAIAELLGTTHIFDGRQWGHVAGLLGIAGRYGVGIAGGVHRLPRPEIESP